MAVADLIASVVNGEQDPIERLSGKLEAKQGELKRLDAELAEHERERRRLFVEQDIDGVDNTKPLDALAKRHKAAQELRGRVDVAIDELGARLAAAWEEQERQALAAAIAEIGALNRDVEQLDAEFSAAAATFFAAAARSAAHNAQLETCLQTISRLADKYPDGAGQKVTPVRCETIGEVNAGGIYGYHELPRQNGIWLSLSISRAASARPTRGRTGQYVPILERLSGYYSS